jgi:hypothetical protein
LESSAAKAVSVSHSQLLLLQSVFVRLSSHPTPLLHKAASFRKLILQPPHFHSKVGGDCMAGPPNDPPDITMMELIATPLATTTPTIRALSSEAPIIRPLSTGVNSNGPIMISMSHEEYTGRTSRESVLQRLSEALMRHSLAKVRTETFFT